MAEPKVTLVSWSSYPIETIYYLWEASRSNEEIQTPDVLAHEARNLPGLAERMRNTFEKVVASGIPVAENLWFVFLLEGISISLREQLVRHRIGVKVGERLGVDLAPDLHDSTWWSQSMRVLDMGEFASKGAYRKPPSVAAEPRLSKLYDMHMHVLEAFYSEMVNQGIPNEDAREVIPLAATHRISWGLNLAAIQHIVSKRSCWILQLGLWEPVIKGMVRELAEKIDPIFYKLATPPCIKNEKWVSCPFELDNEKRFLREDPLPPCSLYLTQVARADPYSAMSNRPAQSIQAVQGRADFQKMRAEYRQFWGRDPDTGVLFANKEGSHEKPVRQRGTEIT